MRVIPWESGKWKDSYSEEWVKLKLEAMDEMLRGARSAKRNRWKNVRSEKEGPLSPLHL